MVKAVDKIWLFGSSGMLGEKVADVAEEQGYEVYSPSHQSWPIELPGTPVQNGDAVVINCAGRLPPTSFPEMIETNAIGPHQLAKLGMRMIHVSTDCVFSGKGSESYHSSQERPDPIDLYGRSKLLGEVQAPHVLNVRTSFIGLRHGFLRWLLDSHGKVEAWIHAYWNGGSVRRVAEAIVTLAEGDQTGVIHLAAAQRVTKAWMVEYLVEELNLPIDSIELVPEPVINRALDPDVLLPPIKQSLDELIEEANHALRV